MNTKWLVLISVVLLTACNTHVHEPWVQDESYLQDERNRSAELAQQLDRRIYGQTER